MFLKDTAQPENNLEHVFEFELDENEGDHTIILQKVKTFNKKIVDFVDKYFKKSYSDVQSVNMSGYYFLWGDDKVYYTGGGRVSNTYSHFDKSRVTEFWYHINFNKNVRDLLEKIGITNVPQKNKEPTGEL